MHFISVRPGISSIYPHYNLHNMCCKMSTEAFQCNPTCAQQQQQQNQNNSIKPDCLIENDLPLEENQFGQVLLGIAPSELVINVMCIVSVIS